MRARIFKPSKTAMQSGVGRSKSWVLEFEQNSSKGLDPLMGWTSSADTQNQVRLHFPNKQAALDYAKDNGIDAQVCEPKSRQLNIRPRGYGENFATERRNPWTH